MSKYFLWTVSLSLILGCVPSTDPIADQARKELRFDPPPETAPLSVQEAIERSKEGTEMLIRAKVGSGKGDTFDAKNAEFLVSEVPEGEHSSGAGHDSDNCPFCRAREAKAPTVVVRLLDSKGTAYPRSAEKLLGLKKGQHVLVRGRGTFDQENNFFSIEANGLSLLK
jgi:hypothetical protein